MRETSGLVVRAGGFTYRVRFSEWTPRKRGPRGWLTGLQFQLAGHTPCHVTFARVDLGGVGFLEGRALCSPRDEVDPEKGTFIALLRLARGLRRLGLRMERA